MADFYLLTCKCGQSVEIELKQAGQQLTGENCKDVLDVPTMMGIRQLPKAAIRIDEKRSKSNVRIRGEQQAKSAAFALGSAIFIAAAIASGLLFYLAKGYYVEMPVIDDGKVAELRGRIDEMSANDLLRFWNDIEAIQLAEYKEPPFFDSVRKHRIYKTSATVAACISVAGLGLAVVGLVGKKKPE
jgi:hypothetical protein